MRRGFTLPVFSLSIAMAISFFLSSAARGQPAEASPPEPEGYTDRICDTPQNLTGSVPVASGATNSDRPSVVWDGAAYGMVWSDDRNGNRDIYFSRVAADGTVLVSPTRITTDSGASTYPSLAWTGTEYGVTWQDSRTTTYDIYFARISASGAKIGADVQITSDASWSNEPSLVWTGSEYGVAWFDGRSTSSDIYFARISATGAKLGSDVQITSDAGTSEFPSLAWAGTEYGVIWQDSRTTVYDLYFARISAAGAKVGTDIQITNDATSSFSPSMVWSGTEYGVAWNDNRSTLQDIYFARVTMAGAKIGTDVQITSDASYSYQTAIAWTGSEYGIAWRDMRDGNYEIYMGRVSAAGAKVSTEVRLSTEGGASMNPALAFGTLGYGVAYDLDSPRSIRFVGVGCHSDSSAPYCPTGVRVTGNSSFGVTLSWTRPGVDYETELAYHRVYREGSPIGITTGDSFTDSPRPSGTPSYQVVAVNANARESLSCTVVTANVPEGDCGGPWTSIQNLVTANSVYGPAIAWDGHAYGVTWTDNRYGNNEILFARVSSDGALLVPPTRVTNDSANSGSPSIAWTGSSFGIVWQDTRTTGYDLYFTRVDTGGNKLIADVQLTSNAANSYGPSLVWTGWEFAVAWYDTRSTGYDIYVNLFDEEGILYDADIQITSAVSASWSPSLVWTGSELGVAWQDNRDGNWEIYFSRLDSSGYPIGANIRITNDSADTAQCDLVWNGTEYGLAWIDSRAGAYEVYFARVSEAGAKVGSDVRITDFPGQAYEPDLVWTGAEYIVAWGDDRYSGTGEIFDATLDSNGYKIGEDRRLTATETYEMSPCLAVGGRGFGLLFLGSGSYSDTLDFMGLGCGTVDRSAPPPPWRRPEPPRASPWGGAPSRSPRATSATTPSTKTALGPPPP
jgi:hypothetical protein